MPKNQNVDERVVEMRIDNKNFESGAKTTISTLEKLQRALHLKSDTKAIDDLSRATKNFDASPMVSSLEKVQASFSALEIAGLRVISNLTDSVYNFATRTVKELTVDQVAAGFSKYGEKTTSVATLTAQGYELEKVNSLMEDLNWFTDETSYNFTDMVGNIAKFTATGQDLDESVTAMEGIALWAALSGQNAQKASMAMYQLSQAMGKGALKYDDYKSIQNASMDTQEFRKQAAAAAEELGVLKQTAEGVWEVVGQGKSFDLAGLFSSDALSRTEWFTSDVMMKVFNKYSKAVSEVQRYMEEHADSVDTASEAMEMMEEEAQNLADTLGITMDEAFKQLGYDMDEFSLKALKAGQNARTWTDVIDSVKDAVSTGWMNTFEYMFGTAENATKFWTDMANDLYDIFATGGNNRNSIFQIGFGRGVPEEVEKAAAQASSWSKLEEKIENSGHSMAEFYETTRKFLASSDSAHFSTLIDRYGSVEAAFRAGAISAETFRQVMAELTGEVYNAADGANASAAAMGQDLEKLREVALGVLHGDYGNGDERRKMLEDLGYDYELIQAMAGQLQGMENMSDEQLMAMMEAYYQYNDVADRLGAGSFEEYLAQQRAIGEDAEYVRDELDDLYDGLLGIANVSGEAVDGLDELESGSDMFKEGIRNLLGVVMSFQESFREAFTNAFGDVDERGARLYRLIRAFRDMTRGIGFSEDAMKGFTRVLTWGMQGLKSFAKLVLAAFGPAIEVIKILANAVDAFFAAIGKAESLEDLNFENVFKALTDGFTGLKNQMKDFIRTNLSEEKLIGIWNRLGSAVDFVWKKIKNFKLSDITQFVPSFEEISASFTDLGTKLRENYPTIMAWYDNFKETSLLGSAISTAFTGIGDAIEWVSGLFDGFNLDFSGVTETFSQLGEIISFLFNGLIGDPEAFKQKIGDTLTTVWDGIKEFFSNLTFADILTYIKDSAVGVLLLEIISITDNIRTVTDNFKTIGESISDFISKDLSNLTKSIAKSFRANAYLKMAVAIGILAGALWLLSEKVDSDRLTNTVAAVSVLILALSLLAKHMNGFVKNMGDTFEKNKLTVNVLTPLSSALIGFAMILGAVAAVMLVARKIGDPAALATFMIGIIVIISGMALVVKKLSELKFEDSKGVIGTILALSFALDLLIPFMIATALMPWAAWWRAVLGMAAAVGALTVAAIQLSKVGDNGGNLLKAAGSIAIMALAMDLLIPFLVTVAALSWESLGKAAAAMAGTLILLGGSLLLMNGITKGGGGKNMLLIAAAIAVLALAFDLMVPALAAFTAMITALAAALPTLIKNLGGFWKAFGKMAAFVTLLVIASVAFGIFAVAVLALGVGVVVLAGGLILLSVALGVLQTSLPVFIESLTKLSDNAGKMTKGLLVLGALAAIAMLLAVALSKLAKITGFDKIMKNIGNGILKAGQAVLTGVANFFKGFGSKIVSFFSDNSNVILKVLNGLVVVIGLYIMGLIPTLVDTIMQAILRLFNTLANAVRNNTGALMHAVTNVLEAIMEVIVSGVSWAFGTLGKLIIDMFTGMIVGVIDMIIDGIDNHGGIVKIAELLGIDITGMREDLMLTKSELEHSGEAFMDGVDQVAEDVKGYLRDNFISEDQAFIPTATVEDAESNAERIAAAWTSIGDAAKDIDTSSLTEGVTGTSEVIEAETGAVEEASSDLGSTGVDAFLGSWFSDLNAEEAQTMLHDSTFGAVAQAYLGGNEAVDENSNPLAGNMAQQLFDAIQSGDIAKTLNNAGDNVTYEAASGANDAIDKYIPTTAENTVIGFANEMQAKKFYAFNAGQDVAAAADAGMRDYLGVRSPSRLMAEIGKYSVLGFVKGVSDNEGSASSVGENLASAMTLAIQLAMSQVGVLADEDFTLSPRITPVVDMSNVTSAASGMDGLFGNPSRKYVNEMISRGSSINAATSVGSSARSSQYNDAVIGEFRSLSSRLDELGARIEGMQIVLDTGVLVGSTSSRMDNQLGRIAARRERAR